MRYLRVIVAATIVAFAAPGLSQNSPAEYVGGKVCAQCHAKAYEAWQGSQHDLAMQEANERTVLGNFADARFTYANTTSTFFKRDGRFMVRTDGPDGKLADYPIRYTFGVTPLQQYLIEFPGGRLQALSIAWDTRPKSAGGQRWFHLYPKQAIKAGDPLHWTGPGQNWNFMCSECHSTNLRKGFDASTAEFRTSWSEVNVSCEACHGPGSRHVAWAKGDTRYALDKGLAVALDERKGVAWKVDAAKPARSATRASSREIDTCARCHARASRTSDDDVHGKPLLDTHRLSLLAENLYWADGQMRDEVYNWGSFLQSRMHAAGVTCSDCHDPHTLKLRAPGNAVCAQCHTASKYDAPAHTHHAAGTTGAACAACHMPTTTYMVIDPRHDHSLRVPRPDESVKYGSPNACNNCHTKQTASWAADAIAKWTGRKPAGYQTFAAAFDAGSRGAPGGRGALMSIADDKAQPALVRASAIARLGARLSPVAIDTLVRALNDSDPIVRLAAVEALARAPVEVRLRYLPRLAIDPVVAVRAAVGGAFVGLPDARMPQEYRAAVAKAQDEYVATLRYNADRPEGRLGLGSYYAARGERNRAVEEYEKAIAIDATFVPAYANLADVLRSTGDEAAAEAVIRRGLARNPNAAALHFALGLSLVRQRKQAQAIGELAAAARLDADSARYAYVYGVALHDYGDRKKAIPTLQAALKRNPYDREILAALASYAIEAGDRDVARGYVKLLRELEPQDENYARMATQIDAGPRR